MRRENTPAGSGGAAEQEIQTRLASIRVGLVLSVVVAVGSSVYALATWDQANRAPILALSVLGLVCTPLIGALPLERIVRGAWREPFFVLWSGALIALIALAAGLDGGPGSPYMLLFILPFLFASISYSGPSIVVVGLLDLAALFIVAFAVGDGLPFSGFGLFAGLCVALLGGWEARIQSGRRSQLAETAEALARSERSSRAQAGQQQEVARFGQLALEGTPIDELGQEACRILTTGLGIGYSVIFKLRPESDELLLVAADGIPKELIGNAVVPAGDGSQSGYALATARATIVNDIDEETRFEPSPLQRSHGIRSAAVVPIQAMGQPYGVISAGSRDVHEFSPEDINFMQSVANVLTNAIERRRTEERTQHEAMHDPLTGLPNRNLFLDRLQHALSVAGRRETSVAVLFLDLDQFKLVNDSLGHAAGDELLAAVSPRIEAALRPTDTVARFGGDEFAVLAEDIDHERGATRIAERIAQALARPFVLRDREHFVSASVGIALGNGSEAPEALIQDADSALYRAKERGRGGYEIFDEVMRSRVIQQMQTENDLRRALQRRELELHYQPVVRLRDGSVVAMEALLRWNHPDRGLLGPLGFIPVAEESRLIVPIGRWVIEEACLQAAAWQALDPDAAPVAVSVNLSARQIADPDLLCHIEDAIAASKIEPSSLWLELTESTLLEEAAFVERTLDSLRDIGVQLVLDDFGVGFSSLGYLKRLPLSLIKLDRSFVENLAEDSHDAAIVRAVNEMADAMGIGVVAEGLETERQVLMASELGCGYAQGFHFAEPAAAGDAAAPLDRAMPVVTW